MQTVHLLHTAPVPTIQRGIAVVHQGAGDAASVQIRENQQHLVRQLTGNFHEKFQVEGGHSPFAVKESQVKVGKVLPVLTTRGVTVEASQLHAGLLHGSSLTTNVLPLLGCQTIQEILETGIVLVVPVKLTVMAGHQEPALHVVLLFGHGKQAVETAGTHALCKPQCRLQHQGKDLFFAFRQTEQTLARGGSIGNGRDQFRIIGKPRSLKGIRPGMVEHELTVGVVFFIKGHGPGKTIPVEDRNMTG